MAIFTFGEGYHNYHHEFQHDYRNGVKWWQWDPTKWMINLCSRVGLATNLTRISNFKIQREILDTQFRRASRKLQETANCESLKVSLEREYQLFTLSVNQWKALQSERYDRKVTQFEDALEERKLKLQEKWEKAAVHTRFKELEYSLKMQRKRLGLLTQQMQLQAQSA
jgi:stearoyl-CoA desaturase (delta-9 desaturase)